MVKFGIMGQNKNIYIIFVFCFIFYIPLIIKKVFFAVNWTLSSLNVFELEFIFFFVFFSLLF